MYNTYPNPRHTTNCKRTKANRKLKWDFTRFVANLCQCVAISGIYNICKKKYPLVEQYIGFIIQRLGDGSNLALNYFVFHSLPAGKPTFIYF